MQLDKTCVAIRERASLETFDLALHLVRRHAFPLIVLLLAGALPLALVNHWLLGWLLAFYAESEFGVDATGSVLRYLWNMSLLVILEAPLGTALVTVYLGKAMFVDRPALKDVLRDFLPSARPLLWCHGLLRGVVPAYLLLLALDRRDEWNPGIEFFLLGALTATVMMVRTFRPYLNEIILLERTPLVSQTPNSVTLSSRSTQLHRSDINELVSRSWTVMFFAPALTGMVFGCYVFFTGTFFNDWQPGPVMIAIVYPLSMWFVAGYLAVVRFLNYLNSRIRQEGWEVELLMRAEAARLQGQAR